MQNSAHPTDKPKGRPTTLVVDLKDLKAPWADWCASHGLTPSEAVRRVLGTVISGSAKGNSAAPESVSAAALRRCEIRLSSDEHTALMRLAEEEGMTLSRWFQALVRLHLSGRPQFGRQEIAALVESNQQIRAIGRNLNQVAHRLNEGSGEGVSAEQMQGLRDAIETHKSHVRVLLDANGKRWRP